MEKIGDVRYFSGDHPDAVKKKENIELIMKVLEDS